VSGRGADAAYEREGEIVKKFFKAVKELNQKPDCMIQIKAIKVHGGVWNSGEPDVVGSVQTASGKSAFAIEFKSPSAAGERSRGTERQRASLFQWKVAGARTGIATSVTEAMGILGILWEERTKRKTDIGVAAGFDEEE
jgi:hypothetical protein